MRTRRGVILILTIGVCAMLAALALGFIARMRDRAVERQEREATQRAQHPDAPAA